MFVLATCCVEGCELEAYESFDECILHCDKKLIKKINAKYEKNFSEKLIDYVKNQQGEIEIKGVNFIKSTRFFCDIFDEDKINFINCTLYDVFLSNNAFYGKCQYKYNSCCFLNDISHNESNYLYASFENCKFKDIHTTPDEAFPFQNYQHCKIKSIKIGLSSKSIEEVSIQGLSTVGNLELEINESLRKLNLIDLETDKLEVKINNKVKYSLNVGEKNEDLSVCNLESLYVVSSNKKLKVNKFCIKNLIFKRDFDLIFQEVDDIFVQSICVKNNLFNGRMRARIKNQIDLIIEDIEVGNGFSLINSKLKNLTIKNSTFNKYLNIGGSKVFNEATLDGVVFLGLFSLSNCTIKNKLALKKCSFFDLSSINFSGMELEEENSFKNTSKETFRIIRDSLDKNGEYREANKYYALEMKKYEEEIGAGDSKAPLSERAVFFLNKHISNFGQNYIKPILWMIFFAFLYLGIYKTNQSNDLYAIAHHHEICQKASDAKENNLEKEYKLYKNQCNLSNTFLGASESSSDGVKYVSKKLISSINSYPYSLHALCFLIFLVVIAFAPHLISLTAFVALMWFFVVMLADAKQLNSFVGLLNDIAAKIIPFQGIADKGKGIEFITLIFHIIFGILLWQTITAVKRHTRR